jgi:hypothetical protein
MSNKHIAEGALDLARQKREGVDHANPGGLRPDRASLHGGAARRQSAPATAERRGRRGSEHGAQVDQTAEGGSAMSSYIDRGSVAPQKVVGGYRSNCRLRGL